jgi:hypothetical protein
MATSLSYEEMLSQLQGLLGSDVGVVMVLTLAGKQRPVGLLSGELRFGQPVDLQSIFSEVADPDDFPEGEAVIFFVGDGARSCFVVRRDDFKRGTLDDEGALNYETGKLRIGIIPGPDTRGG